VVTARVRATGRTLSGIAVRLLRKKGKLVYAGHVGSGYDEAILSDLKKRLDGLKTVKMPFSEPPPRNPGLPWTRGVLRLPG